MQFLSLSNPGFLCLLSSIIIDIDLVQATQPPPLNSFLATETFQGLIFFDTFHKVCVLS